jgi:hypothetical protein
MNKHLTLLTILVILLQPGLVLLPGASALGAVESPLRPFETILYVKPDGSGDCTTWANACELQTALTSAIAGDEIWAAAGTYKPGTNREDAFQLVSGVALYGGFAGSETAREQRDWEANLTVLSGDTGVEGISEDSFHVVVSNGTDSSAVLDGFLVEKGDANGISDPWDRGGGMYNLNSSPTLTNVTFSSNSARYYGGGMWNEVSNPSMVNVAFSGNSSEFGRGGGLYNNGSSPSMTGITFSGNTAEYGGGMYNDASNPALTYATFHDNSARSGGAMFNIESSPVLDNVSISNNSAQDGGGMYNILSNLTLANVAFTGNSAQYGNGGGVWNGDSNPILKNVTFSGNLAQDGGGIYDISSGPTLTNVTISDNTAIYSAGGIYNDSISNPTVTNTIVWSNTPTENQISGDTAIITYSDIQGGYTGTGNLDSDPLLGELVDNGGYTLTHALLPGSPAIDAGDPALCPATDQRGIPRPIDGDGNGAAICDMGAFEYQLPTITNITSDQPDPSYHGEPFIVTIEVTSTSGVPIGMVTVTVNDSPASCSSALVNGQGTCELTLDTPGTYTLTAAYDGVSDYASSDDSEFHSVIPNMYLPMIHKP